MSTMNKDYAERAREILGDCTCSIEYTSRHKIDPHCQWHDNGELFVQALESVARERDEEIERLSIENKAFRISQSSDKVDTGLSSILEISRIVQSLRQENESLKGMIEESDRLLRVAGEKTGINCGSDTADWMADEILGLRLRLERMREALQEILDLEEGNGLPIEIIAKKALEGDLDE